MTRTTTCLALAALLAAAGCDATAPTALSAADAIERIAQEQARTVDEYHAEVRVADDAREAGVAAAFVERVKRNPDNSAQDTAAFLAALAKIRADRDVEMGRAMAAKDNIAALREVGQGLRRIGIEALSLSDEMRRYVTTWIDRREQVEAAKAAERQANTAARQQQLQAAGELILGGVQAKLAGQAK